MSTFKDSQHVPQKRLAAGYTYGGCLEDVVSRTSLTGSSFNENASCDEFWMREALRESMKGVGLSNPNPAVGCILVKDGREIGRGHTQAYGGKHAERVAFEKVQSKSLLTGATAYVTLEPCSHQGHQPPCADLLTTVGLARIVIARPDPDARVSGRGIQCLKNRGIKITVGPLANEVTAWNAPFFATRKRRSPFIALKWAQTLDGQLADDSGRSQWISGESARVYSHWLRQKYDTIMIGAATFMSDLATLTARDCHPICRQPVKLIFDPNNRLLKATGEQQFLFRNQARDPNQPYFVLTKTPLCQKSYKLLGPGFQPVRIEGESLHDQLISGSSAKELTYALGRPLQSVFVEGGPRLLTAMVKSGVADVAHVFISPLITGGSACRISPGRTIAQAPRWKNISVNTLDQDILMEFACS